MKKFLSTLILFLTINIVFAQSAQIQVLVEEGIVLHDSGDYKGALNKYYEALKLEPLSPLVNYEIAYTQFRLSNYSAVIRHCDVILKSNSKLVKDSYVIKGSAYDNMGQHNEAIKTYKSGLKKFKTSNLLHYNIALTYFKTNKLKDAESHLKEAITYNPFHPSSNLVLGLIQLNNNLRVKYLSSLTYFILLEPNSDRSKKNFKDYYRILKPTNDLSVTDSGKINVNIQLSKESYKDDMLATEIAYSLNRADAAIQARDTLSEFDKFSSLIDAFFNAMIVTKLNSKNWWNIYVNFYTALYNTEHYITAKYLLAANLENEEVDEWLELNKDSIQSYYKWHESYFYSKN